MKNHNVRFVLRKLVIALLTVLMVTLLSFLLMRLSPVDPATAYAKRNSAIVTDEQIERARILLGMDKPLPVQYLRWLGGALRFDFGISLGTGHAVSGELGKAIPTTLGVVGFCAVLMAAGVLIFGCITYFFRNSFGGNVLAFLSLAGISLPPFYLAVAFLDWFAVRWNLMSVTGNFGMAKYLPSAICLSVFAVCFYSQMLANSLFREMGEDYTSYARCCGYSETRILLRHAMPHAVIGLLPSFAQMVGLCLAGAAIVERVFSLPGLGYLMIDSVIKRDAPVIHGAVLFLAVALVVLDTGAELLQRFLQKDTRAREVTGG